MIESKRKSNVLIIVIVVVLGLILMVGGVILVLGFITGKTSSKLISKGRVNTYKICEDTIKSEAILYFDSHRVLYPYDSDVTILTEDITSCPPCEGYVIINAKDEKYDVYLKCDDYKTEGFSDSIYNEAINNIKETE